MPISANFLLPKWGAHALDKVRRRLRAHWPRGRSGKLARGQNGVCGQRRRHRQGLRDGPRSPLPLLLQHFVQKLKRRGALGEFKSDPQMPDDQVTLEGVMEQLVIHDSDGREG